MGTATGMKTLFPGLGALMLALLIYTISIDGFPFRKELLTPWMAATLIDFYINIATLSFSTENLSLVLYSPALYFFMGVLVRLWRRIFRSYFCDVWIVYKEASWISSILWVILLVCLGSITTCAYVSIQFWKLTSSQESSEEDLMYYVLLRNSDMHGSEPKTKHSFVATLRILFSILGVVMLATLVYTLVTDGSPFRTELLTPWMVATLVDFYINVVALSVWVVYKESSWVWAVFWVILLICFGSITTCIYVVWQLFQISCQDPAHLILVHRGDRAEKKYKGLPVEAK